MKNWINYKLTEIMDLIGGGTPKTSNPDYWDGDIPWISVKDFNGERRYVGDTEKKITKLGLENSSTKILSKGDIIISARGTVGELAIIPSDMAFNQSCYGLRAKDFVDSCFLYYLLKQSVNILKHNTHGSVFDTITRETFENISVKLPPLPTQQKIAVILSSLDDKIELNNKINTNLEQQAQALFKNWFVDFEPFGGKMPEGWKEVEFRDVCENITDGVHNTVVDDSNGEYLLLSCKNIKGGVLTISSSERKINKETFEKLRKRTKLAKGDILLSSVGTVGEMYLLNETPDNYEFQRSVAIIKPNTSLISPAFLYESMLFQKDTIIHSAHGAVQQCIFISDVGDFKTILPTLDVIDKFTNIIQPMLDTITANQHENQKLANIRDTLLPKLMNGEIEV